MRKRYRLQHKEPHTYWDTTAKPVPVHTWRWKDVCISDDKEALLELIPFSNKGEYRIEDTGGPL